MHNLVIPPTLCKYELLEVSDRDTVLAHPVLYQSFCNKIHIHNCYNIITSHHPAFTLHTIDHASGYMVIHTTSTLSTSVLISSCAPQVGQACALNNDAMLVKSSNSMCCSPV